MPWLSMSSCGTVEPRPPMRLSASWSATMSASISWRTRSTRCGSRRPSSPTALSMFYEARVMQGPLVTTAPIAAVPECFLDVQVGDAERVVLDELAAGLDDVAHQARENLVGDVGLGDFDPQQRAIGRIERRFPQLLGVHCAEALVALDRQALAPGGEHRVEQLGRPRDLNRLALGVRVRGLLVGLDSLNRLGLLLLGHGALLERAERRRLGVSCCLLLRQSVQL